MSKTTIYFIVALVIVASIAVAAVVILQNRDSSTDQSTNTTSQSSLQSTSASTQSSMVTPTNTSSSTPDNTQSSTSATQDSTFTRTSLREFNGRGDNKCYVAVDGTVYDVTGIPEFANGNHTPSGGQVRCGEDGSQAINVSPHGKRVLSNLKVVGELQN